MTSIFLLVYKGEFFEVRNLKSTFGFSELLLKISLVYEGLLLLLDMRDLSNEERALLGRFATEIRNKTNELITETEKKINDEILNKKLEEEKIDVTLPSNRRERGTIHPFNMIVNEIEDLFVSMGYDVLDGPELETDEYCFQRLNIPLGHPVRTRQNVPIRRAHHPRSRRGQTDEKLF